MTGLSRRVRHAVASAALCMTIGAAVTTAWAQRISVDGRFSPAQTLLGPNYQIGASLGRQVGGNLFHSFGVFGLNKGETAAFSGPNTVTNVIARVTGGGSSSIDGTIKSTINGANLYLINPSGVVFGPNAAVNVAGSFHASTADYLRLADGARFQATNADASTLSSAPPAAFGFLNAAPAQITVNGSQLSVPAGQTFGVVGGSVTINNKALLQAPSGTVHVTSAAGTGEVPVDPTNASALTVATLGSVSITGAPTTLDASDIAGKTSGGSIFVNAGRLTIADGGTLDATNYGPGPGGRIALRGDTQIALSNGAQVLALATAAGRSADITLTTDAGGSITASGTSVIDVGSVSVNRSMPTGGAGQLTVNTGTLTLTGDATIGSHVLGSGASGPVTVNANSIMIDGRGTSSPSLLTGLRSEAFAGAVNAADITVNAGTLTILANGEIVTNTFASGNAGRVSVAVTGALTIDATGASLPTGIGSVVSPNATGNAGVMTITAGSLSIVGAPGPLSPTSDIPIPFAGLSAQTLGSGAGGGITLVDNGSLTLSNGGVITATTSAGGPGGTLNLAAQGPLQMTDAGTAITTAALPGASGNAGSVSVSAPQITVGAGAEVTSSTAGPGTGGNITVTATDDITLLGAGPQITARSTGTGDAGAIMLSGLNLKMTGGAAVSTEAATANGGNITMTVSEFMHLVDSQITTSVLAARGNGGNITIDPQLLVLDHSQIIAQAVIGHGGNITIAANEFLPSADSLVSATSLLGISGTVEIIGPRVDLNGALVTLSGELRSAATLFPNSCAARGNRPLSSLTEGGRGGLPQNPEQTLQALYFADRELTPAAPGIAARPGELAAATATPLWQSTHCN